MEQERGFTLIELLTIIGIIGVLAALAINAFSLYRASAAYAVALATVRQSITAYSAGTSDQDNLPAATGLQTQNTPGYITNAIGKVLLTGMQVPKNVTISYEYNPACTDLSCPWEFFVQVKHCAGKEFARFIRFGDGTDTLLQHIGGAGC